MSWVRIVGKPKLNGNGISFLLKNNKKFTPLRLYSATGGNSKISNSTNDKEILEKNNNNDNSSSGSENIDPKIKQIVSQIAELKVTEVASLVSELKKTLNIADIALPAASVAPAASAESTQASESESDAAPPPEEKSLFTIKLESFDAKSKPKVIKEIKSLLGLSLVDSKKFAESAPKLLKENIVKDDVEKIKAAFEAIGAKVTVE